MTASTPSVRVARTRPSGLGWTPSTAADGLRRGRELPDDLEGHALLDLAARHPDLHDRACTARNRDQLDAGRRGALLLAGRLRLRAAALPGAQRAVHLRAGDDPAA